MQKAYDYFISYASENANWARTLRSMLPRTASVFFAEEVPKGQDWETTIRRAITGTRNFVVLVSSASSSATYQRAEVDFALRAAEVDPGMRITPVCVGIGDDALPLGLNLKQAIVITTADEMPQAVAHLVRKPVESGVEENVGALVMELERLLVEKHSSPRTVAWGQDIGSANSGTNRNTRISDLSDKITSGFQPRAGSIVAGATLIKVIGQGAFADVWEAKRRDGSSVAVKVLRAGLLQRDLTLWRFRRGAEALQRLGERKRQKQAGVQPGCVMDLLEIDDSGLAYAMPLMGHGTLESMATFRWSLEQKLVAFDRICSAVQYAHEQTIIHRDIKPGNVMVNDQF
ncbi:MAG TPA: TIR domain-containing protein, partial [Polyangiaceae bacterium]|nr:TIR domain-containing protein [Polyangiaceae bacterium]